MRDASLDDFFGDDESEANAEADTDVDPGAEGPSEATDTASPTAADTPAGPGPDDPDPDSDSATDAEPADSLTVRPAQATYDWSPDGAVCAACGGTVETRWHDPDVGMVCASCKEW
jgi:hypothetical protein